VKVLNYCAGYDTGGYSIRLKQAFDRHSTFPYRSCIGRPASYIRYPTDAPHREARHLQQWADIIHVSHQPLPVTKPQVVQYHGTKFRNNPDKFLTLQKQAGAVAVCSTIDLELLAPDDLVWLPTPYDLDWLATFRKPGGGPVRVGHAPTARKIKSTDVFLDAMTELGSEAELVLIERQPWTTCLELKGTCDVYYDQTILGYGNNAVEAWGMGIPVIAGAQPDTLAAMRHRFGGDLPFYETSEDMILEALVAMMDSGTRQYYAQAGSRHAKQWHDAAKVVAQAETIYKNVLGSD